ncbi:helix-turn-helix transcriptional regulator [Haloferax sp. YSMS24]|uniref:helix-turn-helix transcriptional regulator n=1 Tax=Haloferax sp. YSMS24 TaxID=3388425 RepID=UPI00398C986A
MSEIASPLDAVGFLTRSENRVHALNYLADNPADRNELAATIGISRVTAQRILDDFARHGWVSADGHTYRATQIGSIVSEEFGSLIEVVETSQRLAAIVPWFPDEFDVDLCRLLDSTVTLPTHGDPLAPLRHSAKLMRSAQTVRGMGAGIAPDALAASHDAVVTDGQSFEVVFSDEVLHVIASDARMSQLLREMLDAGATVYSHEDVLHLTGEFDGEVIFVGVADESGIPRGGVESRDEAVLNWFGTTFERYRDEAERVDSAQFKP